MLTVNGLVSLPHFKRTYDNRKNMGENLTFTYLSQKWKIFRMNFMEQTAIILIYFMVL